MCDFVCVACARARAQAARVLIVYVRVVSCDFFFDYCFYFLLLFCNFFCVRFCVWVSDVRECCICVCRVRECVSAVHACGE